MNIINMTVILKCINLLYGSHMVMFTIFLLGSVMSVREMIAGFENIALIPR